MPAPLIFDFSVDLGFSSPASKAGAIVGSTESGRVSTPGISMMVFQIRPVGNKKKQHKTDVGGKH